MQQAEAKRAESVLFAPALETTPNDMKLEINTLKCVTFYFLYPFGVLCSF